MSNGHHVEVGQTWKHKKTGRHVTVTKVHDQSWGKAELCHHTSGRTTEKAVHYFIYDYERTNTVND